MLCQGLRTEKCKEWGITEIKLLDLVITQGADINDQTIKGLSPLVIATTKSNFSLFEALLIRGANGLLADKSTTALHEAAIHGNYQYISALLKLQPTLVLHKSLTGDTALHLAVQYNPHNKNIKALILAGANINQLNDNNKTPIDIAKKQGNEELATLMLEWAQEYSKSSQ